jgi:hypothetical protein
MPIYDKFLEEASSLETTRLASFYIQPPPPKCHVVELKGQ